jgi:hypothetical protein
VSAKDVSFGFRLVNEGGMSGFFRARMHRLGLVVLASQAELQDVDYIFAVQVALTKVEGVNVLCFGKRGLEYRRVPCEDAAAGAVDVILLNHFDRAEISRPEVLERIDNALIQMRQAARRSLRLPGSGPRWKRVRDAAITRS